MAKDLAIALLDGGMNAAVAAALAARTHRLILLHADYATPPPMRAAYDQQAAHFKPYRAHVLAGPLAPPTEALAPGAKRAAAPLAEKLLHLLPLIGEAARLAAEYEAASIHLGLRVGTDPSGDQAGGDLLAQATEYLQVWNEMLQIPCARPELEIVAPLLELDLWQVVDVGFNAAAPFDKTCSCHEPGPLPCWTCRGCRARAAAFQRAAKPDPLRQALKA